MSRLGEHSGFALSSAQVSPMMREDSIVGSLDVVVLKPPAVSCVS